MRLVHDHEIPVDLLQPRQDVGAFCQVERRDDAGALEPLIHPELLAQILPLHDQECGVELLFHLALPLEGEVRRADDQDALG